MPSQYLTIPLPNHPDLVRFQNMLRERLTDVREWQDPATFHITIAYVPDAIDVDLSDLHVPATRPFSAKALKLHSFDANDDGVPVVLLVEKHPSLMRLQAALVRQIKETGVQISPYSESAAWTPHITMCYTDSPCAGGMLRQPIEVTIKKVDLAGEGYQTMASFLVGKSTKGQISAFNTQQRKWLMDWRRRAQNGKLSRAEMEQELAKRNKMLRDVQAGKDKYADAGLIQEQIDAIQWGLAHFQLDQPLKPEQSQPQARIPTPKDRERVKFRFRVGDRIMNRNNPDDHGVVIEIRPEPANRGKQARYTYIVHSPHGRGGSAIYVNDAVADTHWEQRGKAGKYRNNQRIKPSDLPPAALQTYNHVARAVSDRYDTSMYDIVVKINKLNAEIDDLAFHVSWPARNPTEAGASFGRIVIYGDGDESDFSGSRVQAGRRDPLRSASKATRGHQLLSIMQNNPRIWFAGGTWSNPDVSEERLLRALERALESAEARGVDPFNEPDFVRPLTAAQNIIRERPRIGRTRDFARRVNRLIKYALTMPAPIWKALDGEFLTVPEDRGAKAARDKYGRILHDAEDEGQHYTYFERTPQSQAHFDREMTKLRDRKWAIIDEQNELEDERIKLRQEIEDGVARRFRGRGVGDGRDMGNVAPQKDQRVRDIRARERQLYNAEIALDNEIARLERDFPDEAEHYRATKLPRRKSAKSGSTKAAGIKDLIRLLRKCASEAGESIEALSPLRGDHYADIAIMELGRVRDWGHQAADQLETAAKKSIKSMTAQQVRQIVSQFRSGSKYTGREIGSAAAQLSASDQQAIQPAMQKISNVLSRLQAADDAMVDLVDYLEKGVHTFDSDQRQRHGKSARKGRSIKYGAFEQWDGAQSDIANMMANFRMAGLHDLEKELSMLRPDLAAIAQKEGYSQSLSTGYPDYGAGDDPKSMIGVAVSTLYGTFSKLGGLVQDQTISPESRALARDIKRRVAAVAAKAKQRARTVKSSKAVTITPKQREALLAQARRFRERSTIERPFESPVDGMDREMAWIQAEMMVKFAEGESKDEVMAWGESKRKALIDGYNASMRQRQQRLKPKNRFSPAGLPYNQEFWVDSGKDKLMTAFYFYRDITAKVKSTKGNQQVAKVDSKALRRKRTV